MANIQHEPAHVAAESAYRVSVTKHVIGLIQADMVAGRVPDGLKDFSELHDYVDANDYLLIADPMPVYDKEDFRPGVHPDAMEAYINRANAVMTAVSEWMSCKRYDAGWFSALDTNTQRRNLSRCTGNDWSVEAFEVVGTPYSILDNEDGFMSLVTLDATGEHVVDLKTVPVGEDGLDHLLDIVDLLGNGREIITTHKR